MRLRIDECVARNDTGKEWGGTVGNSRGEAGRRRAILMWHYYGILIEKDSI